MKSFRSRLEEKLTIPDSKFRETFGIADVAIGIGCDLHVNGREGSPATQAIARKLGMMYEDGEVRNLLFAGGKDREYQITGAQAMYDVLRPKLERGTIEESDVYFEEESNTTYLNAELTLPIIQEKGWDSVVLVAQQWHARRVYDIFKYFWKNDFDVENKLFIRKAWSPYNQEFSQKRLWYFPGFVGWDTLTYGHFYKMRFTNWCKKGVNVLRKRNT